MYLLAGSKNKICLKYEESHKEIDGVLYKLCTKCWEWFPCTNEYFYKNNSPDGLFPSCKECEVKRAMKWAEENPEKYKEGKKKYHNTPRGKAILKQVNINNKEKGAMEKWRKNNPDKCREYAQKHQHKKHDITIKQWESCKKYFIHRCAYCNLPIEEHWVKVRGNIQLGDFHKEHVDDNGANDLSNCVPSCKICNSSKREYTLEEWYPQQEFYSEEKYNKITKWTTEDYKKLISK